MGSPAIIYAFIQLTWWANHVTDCCLSELKRREIKEINYERGTVDRLLSGGGCLLLFYGPGVFKRHGQNFSS